MSQEAIAAPEAEVSGQSKAQLHSVPVTTQIGALTLSREFDQIVSAMGDIQSAINAQGIGADKQNEVLLNPYSSLPAILKELSPLLKQHGITMLQPWEVSGSTVRVTTVLIKGKQFASMSSSVTADSPHAQAIGSAVTYCCRYSVRAMLCLAVDLPGESDDDGNRASGRSASAAQEPQKATESSTGTKVAPDAQEKASGKAEVSKSDEPAGYSEALRGYLKRVEISDIQGLASAEAQVSAFRLAENEKKILLDAIADRKAKLSKSDG